MIRTKDLVLFLLCLLILFLAIVTTLVRQNSGKIDSDLVIFTAGDEVAGSGVYEESVLDRASIISRLKEAIAKQETISAPVLQDEPEPVVKEEVLTKEVVLQRCEVRQDAVLYASLWPREGVTVQVAEGVISVAKISEIIKPVSATTSSTTTKKTETSLKVESFLQLPLVPNLGEAKCLSSEIIGVTTGGALLFNFDAMAYHGTDAGNLLGYARDGVPVYGVYNGDTDECGGYEVNGQYRYSVNSERNYILGCYRGDPRSFIGE